MHPALGSPGGSAFVWGPLPCQTLEGKRLISEAHGWCWTWGSESLAPLDAVYARAAQVSCLKELQPQGLLGKMTIPCKHLILFGTMEK